LPLNLRPDPPKMGCSYSVSVLADIRDVYFSDRRVIYDRQSEHDSRIGRLNSQGQGDTSTTWATNRSSFSEDLQTAIQRSLSDQSPSNPVPVTRRPTLSGDELEILRVYDHKGPSPPPAQAEDEVKKEPLDIDGTSAPSQTFSPTSLLDSLLRRKELSGMNIVRKTKRSGSEDTVCLDGETEIGDMEIDDKLIFEYTDDFSHFSNDSNVLECSICWERVKDGDQMLALPGCSHVYHSDCISDWLVKKSSLCPMCRNDIGPYCRGEKPMDPEFVAELKNAELTQRFPEKYEWRTLKDKDSKDIIVLTEKERKAIHYNAELTSQISITVGKNQALTVVGRKTSKVAPAPVSQMVLSEPVIQPSLGVN